MVVRDGSLQTEQVGNVLPRVRAVRSASRRRTRMFHEVNRSPCAWPHWVICRRENRIGTWRDPGVKSIVHCVLTAPY